MGIGVFYKEQGKNLIAVSPTVDKVDDTYESSNWMGITTNPSLSLLFDNNLNVEVSPNDFFVKYEKNLNMRKMDGVTIGLKLFRNQIFSY